MTTTLTDRKSVYPTDEIPHLWAHGIGERTIRNPQNNLWAEGDTIYSYGRHFPIAKRVVRKDGSIAFLVTTDGRSNTTARHIHRVRMAISGLGDRFDVSPGNHREEFWSSLISPRTVTLSPLVADLQGKIDAFAREAVKPRIRAATAQSQLDAMAGVVAFWGKLREAFGIKTHTNALKVPANLDELRIEVAEASKRQAKAQALAAKVRDEAIAKRELELANRESIALEHCLTRWRDKAQFDGAVLIDGRNYSVDDIRYPVLRIINAENGLSTDGPKVETSRGARVTVDEAQKALRIIGRLLQRIRAEGEPQFDYDATIGAYGRIGATLADFKIGCHTIPWKEVRAFCTHVGWECPTLPGETGWEVASI